jgi:3-oxoacyl-[acyl-carrier protein] reductase
MSERLIPSLQLAFHTMEAMRRQLASQLGQCGLRVVTSRTDGCPVRSA